jgi:hypothetical protein
MKLSSQDYSVIPVLAVVGRPEICGMKLLRSFVILIIPKQCNFYLGTLDNTRSES